MKRALVVTVGVMVAACGARTALNIAGDASIDAPIIHDAAHEADAIEEDVVSEDSTFPDVPIIGDCPDAGDTLIYLLGAKSELYSFYPPTLSFKNIGTIACPSSSTPNSMAVTRTGIAFTGFLDGTLFEISTANAACKPTAYQPDQQGWHTFGMGYAASADGGESLYVAGNGNQFAKGLGIIDTTTFALDVVGPFQPQQQNCELSGTGDGRLFGFCPFNSGSWIIQIDPPTAKVLSAHQLSTGGATSFAFAFWGGVFWIFTGSAQSTVTRYDPVAQTESNVATAQFEIVGAGVSTCAPE